ncbi:MULTISPECIES: two pore domain potassium channel family protein [Providencia]|uniref:two pore domain potassium channel family protein n=1 Tax=Providencia TaxID=586 RepID=UPI001E466115|nr:MULTISPECIES: two pore domain potassium channel family protein [Providencia]UEK58364.1 two pore domain potassium channel family protein [Providencia rettgeri]
MFESKNMPLISFSAFLKRMLLHFSYAFALIIITLLIGIVGHIAFDSSINWHDAIFNSAFIANGIGPYIVPQSISGKIFFVFYGIFTSLVFMTTLGLIFAPIAHRMLHKFHLDDE